MLLYCQAARRIVEGFPFSFSAGTAVSTGTTSHLYPFLLAIPFALGATEEALFRAGFVLNAFFYLLFLFGWGLVLDAFVRSPTARWIGVGLLVGLGQTAFSAFAQSDIGLWMAVSSFIAAGLIRQDGRIYGPLLVLAPWVRPEGMICVLAFFGFLVVAKMLSRRSFAKNMVVVQKADWLWAILGVSSFLGVFLFNYALTGACQFSSVAQKGHFYLSNSLASGLNRTVTDFAQIVKAYVLGLSLGVPRDFVFVPIFGCAMAWLGVGYFCIRKQLDWRYVVWVFAIGGGVLTVAMSGWQDTNYDRYFAWMLPTGLVCMSLGIECMEQREKLRLVARMIGVGMLLWSVCGSVASVSSFYCASREITRLIPFAKQCEEMMPKGASVGTNGESGIAYALSNRRVVNLAGIYSPELFDGEWPVGRLEILKNEKSTRFDYWLILPSELESAFGFKLEKTLGHQELTGPDGRILLRSDWSLFDAAIRHSALALTNYTQVARLDVAYAKDERAADYEILPLYDGVAFASFMKHGKLNGKFILDGGRLVAGQDEMTIPTCPGKDLIVVMRTGDECVAIQNGEFSSVQRKYAFANPLKLNLQVDGVPAGLGEAQLATNAFSDVTFTIPGKFITKERSRIAFCGDHVAYAYWFYQ